MDTGAAFKPQTISFLGEIWLRQWSSYLVKPKLAVLRPLLLREIGTIHTKSNTHMENVQVRSCPAIELGCGSSADFY